MKVFVSSLISGMELIRSAAREAVTTLRHEPVMAEDFGARPHSPQVACLTGLRESDLMVLILGDHYGAVQPSGLSATHEEYRDAKDSKPVIAFVEESANRDLQQTQFVKEVQQWQRGLLRSGFKTVSDFKTALTRALHDYDIANAVGPVDQQELTERAKAFLPKEHSGISGSAALNLAVAGGPRQAILRPAEIESTALTEAMHQAALFGKYRIFDPKLGTTSHIQGDTLIFSQEREQSQILLNEQGSVRVTVPLRAERNSFPQLIHEFVQKQLTDALGYVAWILDHVDATQHLTHVAVATSISNADHLGWRTQHENDASPNRITLSMGGFGSSQRGPVHISRPRAALRLDSARIVEDLIVPLRRQWR